MKSKDSPPKTRNGGGSRPISPQDEALENDNQRTRIKEGAAAHKSINEEVGLLLRILGETGDPIRLRLRRTRKLKLPTRERVGRALTIQERDALLAAARKRRSRHIYPALLLSIDAGMRDEEIRNLQWGRVDLEKKIVRVGTSKTQAGEGRTIPMSPAVNAALAEHAGGSRKSSGPPNQPTTASRTGTPTD